MKIIKKMILKILQIWNIYLDIEQLKVILELGKQSIEKEIS